MPPEKLEDEEGAPKVNWTGYVAAESTGNIVDFPAPPSPPPVETEQGEKDVEWAALMLETLRNYCETMAAVKGEQTVPWTDYADALDVVLSALRR